MPTTNNIASQFAIMHNAAQHPSPAVRRLAANFAKNLKKVNNIINKNKAAAALALKKMRHNRFKNVVGSRR